MNADIIFVVSDGQVVEQGSHEELIAKDGKYAELWSKQIFLKPKDAKDEDNTDDEAGDTQKENKKPGKKGEEVAPKSPPPRPSAPKPSSPKSARPKRTPPRPSLSKSSPVDSTSPKPSPKPKPKHLQTDGLTTSSAAAQTNDNGKSNRQDVGTPKNGHKREVDQSKDHS